MARIIREENIILSRRVVRKRRSGRVIEWISCQSGYWWDMVCYKGDPFRHEIGFRMGEWSKKLPSGGE